MIELEKGKTGLGLSLAGNRDRSRMSVFVVGIDPNGAAGEDGRMVVGDELLEVSHLVTDQKQKCLKPYNQKFNQAFFSYDYFLSH